MIYITDRAVLNRQHCTVVSVALAPTANSMPSPPEPLPAPLILQQNKMQKEEITVFFTSKHITFMSITFVD